ncbi:hypothetical protein P7K49_026189 [Saguinus oedipus]|uniref:Uncharacterized protein n=1 Tax=Saguinus oedipus TaxID=9490 RepID=A0ABQ9UCH5_SAGOE|nr:hypothetical protein P7K49_026189 [Saguinus oedipus]
MCSLKIHPESKTSPNPVKSPAHQGAKDAYRGETSSARWRVVPGRSGYVLGAMRRERQCEIQVQETDGPYARSVGNPPELYQEDGGRFQDLAHAMDLQVPKEAELVAESAKATCPTVLTFTLDAAVRIPSCTPQSLL